MDNAHFLNFVKILLIKFCDRKFATFSPKSSPVQITLKKIINKMNTQVSKSSCRSISSFHVIYYIKLLCDTYKYIKRGHINRPTLELRCYHSSD